MATNKFGVKSLAPKLSGSDNWLDPVQTVLNLPLVGVQDGDAALVFADPNPANRGIWLRQGGQWEYAPGGGGGGIPAFQDVLASGGLDAIQSRVDALPLTGGTIFLQAGSHTVDAQAITVNKPNVCIRGEGFSSVILIENATAAAFFTVTEAGFEMRDLTIRVTGDAATGADILRVLASRADIHRVRFEGLGHRPFYIDGTDCTIDACFADGDSSLEFFTFCRLGPLAQNLTIRNCRAVDFFKFCIGNGSNPGVLLSQNVFSSPAGNFIDPIFASGLFAPTIVNNEVRSDTTSLPTTLPIIDVIGEAQITHNWVSALSGLKIASGLVAYNQILGCTWAVRKMSQTARARISHNLIGTARRGTMITVDGRHNDVSSNTIGVQPVDPLAPEPPGPPPALVGVWIQDQYNIASFNQITGTDTAILIDPVTPAILLKGNMLTNNIYEGVIDDQGLDTLQSSNLLVSG